MSTMQHIGKGFVRGVKNYTKGYSDVQAKVRDATSNDSWGPTGAQMNELAQLSYNQDHFVEIMEMLDKRLNDKGKNWRHVFKSLTVLDYLLHAGSENVVIYFKDNIYIVKTLKEFQYVNEEGKDEGANVRQKAKDITNLLHDESRLREERRDRAHMRERMVGRSEGRSEDDENGQRRAPTRTRRNGNNEDDDLRKALEESKRTAAEEQSRQTMTAEERDLQQAIRLSEEEQAKRSKALEDANQAALFDESQPSQSSSTNSFPLVDTSLQVQGSQFGLHPQITAQYTSFNPYAQQAQQEAMQAEYMRQQQQQQEWQMLQAQQQQAQQAQLQAQQMQQLQQAQQEEWMRQQQQQQQQSFLMPQQPLVPQATGFGSNNPFAPSLALSTPSLPTYASSPGQQSASPVSFNLQGTYGQASASSPPPLSQSAPPSAARQNAIPAVKTRADDDHSKLANILANRGEDGVDTFGNWGSLRYGQQAGRLIGQPTGAPASAHNPFALQQQQQQQQQQQPQNSDQPFFSI